MKKIIVLLSFCVISNVSFGMETKGIPYTPGKMPIEQIRHVAQLRQYYTNLKQEKILEFAQQVLASKSRLPHESFDSQALQNYVDSVVAQHQQEYDEYVRHNQLPDYQLKLQFALGLNNPEVTRTIELYRDGFYHEEFFQGYAQAPNTFLPWGQHHEHVIGKPVDVPVEQVQFADQVRVYNNFCILLPEHLEMIFSTMYEKPDLDRTKKTYSSNLGREIFLLVFKELTLSRFANESKNSIECGLSPKLEKLFKATYPMNEQAWDLYNCLKKIVEERDFVTKVCVQEMIASNAESKL